MYIFILCPFFVAIVISIHFSMLYYT